MRPRAASSGGLSNTSRPAADVLASPSLFQAKASRFFKNLSNFTRGKKNSSDTCSYNTNDRNVQLKPSLSQPALVISDFSPERGESSSSVTPSPLSRASHVSVGVPSSGTGSRSICLADGSRSDRQSDSALPTSHPETINHAGRSPNILTLSTSPASGRSISFDISRLTSHKHDQHSKRGGSEAMSPLTISQGNLGDVPEHRSPHEMINGSSPSLLGIGCSPTSPLAPEIEGLPGLGESIDLNLLKLAEPAGQPPADQVPGLSPDRTPTPPSRSPMPPQPPDYHEATNSPVLTPADISPAILPPKRVALLRLSSLPPSAFTMNDEDGSVRFSPAQIGRHFPTAVRPLPPASVARRSSSPAPSLWSNGSRVRLRSVPALAIDGTDEREGDGSGDDEDDNEDDHVLVMSPTASDDEDDDAATERDEGSTAYVSANASPGDLPSPSTPSRGVDVDKTSVLKPPQDYFSIQPARSDSVNWMSSGSNPKRASLTPNDRPAALYHQASRSMVNLLSSQRRDLSIIDEETKGKGKAIDSVSSAVANDTNILPEGSRVQRRRSLPTFTEATEPPPYPSLEIPTRFGPKVFPRDEEGKEKLPAYSNDILLSAVLPRKVEFSSPGVQARDRKWRRVLCVLEGTVFRVCEPPASMGIGPVGRWWERKVGVGDLTSDAPRLKKTGILTPGSQKIDQDLDGTEGRLTVGPIPGVVASERGGIHPAKKPKLHPSGFLSPSGNTSGTSSRRHSGETSREDNRNGLLVSASRPSVSSITTTGRPSISLHRPTASPMSTRSAQPVHVPHTPNCQPLRIYTLQHAESGLASDYLKRKNVIRVRMEGEQFLLQAPSVQAVIEWVEGFQAATGIALDLDERQMPKGPIFPRRRRRRARFPNTPNSEQQTQVGRTNSRRQ